MTTSKRIEAFTGQYEFLSNFYLCPVWYEGRCYASVEHAYQAAKSLDENVRHRIYELPTAAQAKKAGRKVQLRSNWDVIRVEVMTGLVRAKFQYPPLQQALLRTGDLELIEGNWWGDRFWGVFRGQGENMLGKILMQVRQEAKEKNV